MTHLRFDPLELLERLAVLTPRPRVNLVLYYGVLAPRAPWRGAIAPGIADQVGASEEEEDGDRRRAKPLPGWGVSVGGVDAPDIWRRRLGLSTLWWAAAPRGAD
jgi:hypothetical protein